MTHQSTAAAACSGFDDKRHAGTISSGSGGCRGLSSNGTLTRAAARDLRYSAYVYMEVYDCVLCYFLSILCVSDDEVEAQKKAKAAEQTSNIDVACAKRKRQRLLFAKCLTATKLSVLL